jgi:D-xylose transport system ATP-binding protein
MTNTAPLVELRHIAKSFGGVHAVEDVSLDLYPGEVVGVVGHNGAGKSTLMKILSGALRADSGEIRLQGQVALIRNPRDAQAQGIETIYQTLALADNLHAPANLFLGRELKRANGALNEEAMAAETERLLQRLNLRLPSLKEPVQNLSGGQRQAVAIARAIYFDAKILIMDEPTAALGPEETKQVSELIFELKRQGIGIFLISHDLHDVFDLSDRISVLRHGQLVATVSTQDVTEDEVLGMIILGKRSQTDTIVS